MLGSLFSHSGVHLSDSGVSACVFPVFPFCVYLLDNSFGVSFWRSSLGFHFSHSGVRLLDSVVSVCILGARERGDPFREVDFATVSHF